MKWIIDPHHYYGYPQCIMIFNRMPKNIMIFYFMPFYRYAKKQYAHKNGPNFTKKYLITVPATTVLTSKVPGQRWPVELWKGQI